MSDPSAPALPLGLTRVWQYVGSYLLGILTCILLTPVELTLAGAVLWPFYGFAVIGVPLYLLLTPEYVWGSASAYWWGATISLIPLLFEIGLRLTRRPSLSRWRPWWIAFPLGFLGTLGIYYTVGASI